MGDVFTGQFFAILATISTILSVALFAVSLWMWLALRKVRHTMSVLFSGKTVTDLEALLLEQKADITELDREVQELYDVAEKLYRLGQESIHKTEILRFNPFKEVGGNQSFAIALLNGKNTGFVLSSLHTREGTRIYSKPVVNGAELKEYPLTAEEKQTVAKAAKKYSEVFTTKS